MDISMLTVVEFIGASAGVVGQVFISRMDKRGWYCWILSTLCLLFVTYQSKQYSMTAMYGYYLAGAVYGAWFWSRKKETIPCQEKPLQC